MSYFNSDAFLHTAHESGKQRTPVFSAAEKTLDLLIKLLTLVHYVFLITDLTGRSKTCDILCPYFCKLRKPMVQICWGLLVELFRYKIFFSFSFVTCHCWSYLLRYWQALGANTLKLKSKFRISQSS